MNLSVIQFDAIMQAINSYKDELNTTGIDPYSNEENYTEEGLLKALGEVEEKIIIANIPT